MFKTIKMPPNTEIAYGVFALSALISLVLMFTNRNLFFTFSNFAIVVFMVILSASVTYLMLEPKFAKPNTNLLAGSPGGACLSNNKCNDGSSCDTTLKVCHATEKHSTPASQ